MKGKGMIKNLKSIIVAVACLCGVVAPILAPVPAFAATSIEQNLCGGTNASATTGDCQTGQANSQVSKIMTNIINFFSLLVGIVSVIMIIIGGFQYVMSNGDSGKISTAKNTIIFALVGLIIVAMAQFIVHFVLGKIAGY
jgi:cytochrome bd-type quinol oxidase subunit 2